jgi:hypothetical protein
MRKERRNMADKPYTKKPLEVVEPPKIPEKSKKPSDYVEVDEVLYCKTCATEHELHICKCGKRGPESFIQAHLVERMARGGPALKNHALVRPAPPTPPPEKPMTKAATPVDEPDPEPVQKVEKPKRRNIFDKK